MGSYVADLQATHYVKYYVQNNGKKLWEARALHKETALRRAQPGNRSIYLVWSVRVGERQEKDGVAFLDCLNFMISRWKWK